MMRKITRVILFGLTVFLMAAGPVEDTTRSLAPNFILKDLNQVSVELASFKNRSHLVLFFWTTWCPYCLRAMKNLNQILPELNKEGITVLPINTGESQVMVAEFAKKNGYAFRIFLDADSEVSGAYHINGVPTYFIVDKKGYVRSISNSFPDDEIRKLARNE